MTTYHLVQGATGQSIGAQLLGDDATIQNLTGCTVVARLRRAGRTGGPVLGGAAVITNATLGQVRYDPATADLANAGDYDLEWDVTLPSGRPITYPSPTPDRVVVRRSVA